VNRFLRFPESQRLFLFEADQRRRMSEQQMVDRRRRPGGHQHQVSVQPATDLQSLPGHHPVRSGAGQARRLHGTAGARVQPKFGDHLAGQLPGRARMRCQHGVVLIQQQHAAPGRDGQFLDHRARTALQRSTSHCGLQAGGAGDALVLLLGDPLRDCPGHRDEGCRQWHLEQRQSHGIGGGQHRVRH